ncbi:hypothetical protein ERJ75_000275200 [Trypanosoma vivax]|nr:hypothetical protein TRVL_01864 [Trypanosoma vivax]KAH8618460.1 hypothetical protein ERJ75_000275200 [Trypanosoma vivax]
MTSGRCGSEGQGCSVRGARNACWATDAIGSHPRCHAHDTRTPGGRRGPVTPARAIRIQRELSRRGVEPVAAEPRSRMFPSEYASPTQMLRLMATGPRDKHEADGGASAKLRNISLGASEKNLVPCFYRLEPCAEQKGSTTTRTLAACRSAKLKAPPFPSIAARLENDVALGISASSWPSGNVVGHCDDRLAQILVLSAVIVRCRGPLWPSEAWNCTTTGRAAAQQSVTMELRQMYMEAVERLLYVECGTTSDLLEDSNNPARTGPQCALATVGSEEGWDDENSHEGSVASTRSASGRRGRMHFVLDDLPAAVLSTSRVLKGFVEPSTLSTAAFGDRDAPRSDAPQKGVTVSAHSMWRYSLVRTAEDVPNRYDILDAMACVLEPCPGLKVRRVFCAVARQLALQLLNDATDGHVGLRGAAAAIAILQHINGRTECLAAEERIAGQRLLAVLERRLLRLQNLLPPELSLEATTALSELIASTQLFCGCLG